MRPGRKLDKETLKLLAAMSFATLGAALIGLDLLDGDAEIRAWHVNVTEAPLGFGLMVLVWAAATVAVAFVWWCVVLLTRADDRRRAPLDEPSHRYQLGSENEADQGGPIGKMPSS